jgi:cohesin loading factor subunit SCC2
MLIRLRNNASIQTVSALLLHLVQTCSADLDQQVKKVLAGNLKDISLEDEDGDVKMQSQSIDAGESTLEDEGERLVSEGLLCRLSFDELTVAYLLVLVEPRSSSASRSCLRFGVQVSSRDPRRSPRKVSVRSSDPHGPLLLLNYLDSLIYRSSKAGKAASGTADAEYRKVLDHLIADLLSTLHLPEWPGSELFLTVLCRYMVSKTELFEQRTCTKMTFEFCRVHPADLCAL